jgi:hypothetical protein
MSFKWCDLSYHEDKVTKAAERFITAYCMAKEENCGTCPLNRNVKSYNANAKFVVKNGELAIIDSRSGEKLW